jgi:hypothetical protein
LESPLDEGVARYADVNQGGAEKVILVP